MDQTPQVREATAAERPEVAEVTRLSYAQYAVGSTPEFWARYEDSTRKKLLEDDDARRFVVLTDGRIVASVLWCPPNEQNPCPELRLLAVLPEHRNRKLGDLLIKACETLTLAAGFEAITLHPTALMPTARSMYERRGYRPFPDLDFEPAPGFVVWGYKKRLA